MINELELKINHNTMVLVLSDMHLGALHTEKSCFNMFLSSVYEMIKDNKLPNLKAMIIIGDIFDLIMDSYTDILKLKDYQNILEKINQLHDIDDFNIVFTLGNHEVPVIGNYDTEFPENKKGMLNNFNREQKKTDIEYSFFKNNDIFSQYILLQSEDLGRSRPIIKLFDTKQDIIRDNSINTIDLNVKANSTEFNNFFLTHGYQFDPNLSFFSKVWYIGLKNPFSFIKQIGDLIWNGVIKKIYEAGRKLFNPDKNDDDEKRETGVDVISKKKVEKMIKTGKKTYLKKKKKKDGTKLTDEEDSELDKVLEKKLDSDSHREALRDNKPSMAQIRKKFIPDLINSGYHQEINHVIYGHTHSSLIELIKREFASKEAQISVEFETEKFSISNPGAWQHVKKPSFLEIYTDWTVHPNKVKKFIGDMEKIKDRQMI